MGETVAGTKPDMIKGKIDAKGRISVTTFREEEAEAIELVATEESKYVGQKLRDIRFPRGSIVGAIVRPDGEAIVPPSGAGGVAHPFPAPAEGRGEVVIDEGGVKVTAFRVDHTPVDPAVGYRFDYGERSLVVSGDTIKSENLQRFADGVDLLVH
ncbi:MAG: hypothetical protein GY825_11580, partial [Phycisphaeraceae bacterium]|nr:hypothetical protein [Phycisphaeraceae bacterium]